MQYLAGKGVGSVHNHMFVEQHGEWQAPVAGAGPGGDMRAASPTHNHSPAHSNRNSAASSDSGRGFSTGHLEPKVVTVSVQNFCGDLASLWKWNYSIYQALNTDIIKSTDTIQKW